MHVAKFFARNLEGLIRDVQGMPLRLMKAKMRVRGTRARTYRIPGLD